MAKVVVLGASGAIARHANQMLANDGHELTLTARNTSRIAPVEGATLTVGDATNTEDLEAVFKGQEVVYANLAGDVITQAKAIAKAMENVGLRKLVWVSSLGIYDEVPGAFGQWNSEMIGSALRTYREAVDVLEAADLDLVVIRPAWLTDADEVDYEITSREDAFKGTEVSRKSVAALITELIANDNGWDISRSLGVNKPGTDGDKPAWF